MPGPEDIVVYCGVPHTGKTTLALRHAADLVESTGLPLLVVDSIRAKQFRTWYHARSVEEVGELLYTRGAHACFFPKTDDEFDRLIRGVIGGRDCILLVDELSIWANNRRVPPALNELLRAHCHLEVPLLTTTQSVRDLAREVRVAATEAYVFFTDEIGDLEVIGERWKIENDKIFSLGIGQCVRWRRSDRLGKPPSPPPPAPIANS